MKSKEQISSQTIDAFIQSIQALNFSDMKEYLRRYGERIVNCLQSRTRMPSLYFAIKINDQRTGIATIKELIAYGANLQFRDLFGNSFLHHSCNFQKTPIFKFVLQTKTCQINELNIFKQSVLFSIAQQNNLQLLQYLCEYDYEIDVNQQDAFGRNALFYAAEKGHVEMCEILLKMGIDANKVDYEGHTAQYYARKLQRIQVVTLLSQHRKKQKKQVPSELLYNFNLYHLNTHASPQIMSIQEVVQFLQVHKHLKELFINPQLAQNQPYQQSSEKWQEKACKIIELCLQQQGSNFFQFPVDQEMFGISDYYQRIKQPMDFSTIQTKLIYHGYTDSKQFIKDMELVFANCVEYNGKEHYIASLAIQIRNYFRAICIL